MAKTKKNATEGLNGALARLIRGELAARGMTRDELSQLSGVPRDSLSNYLSSSPTRARVMDVDVVAALARALGMGSAQLIAKAEERLRDEQWLRADMVERGHSEEIANSLIGRDGPIAEMLHQGEIVRTLRGDDEGPDFDPVQAVRMARNMLVHGDLNDAQRAQLLEAFGQALAGGGPVAEHLVPNQRTGSAIANLILLSAAENRTIDHLQGALNEMASALHADDIERLSPEVRTHIQEALIAAARATQEADAVQAEAEQLSS